MSDAPARFPVTNTRVVVIDGDTVRERPDRLVTEEPMEIRVHGPGQEPRPLAVTMRTPGHDFELAVGFCVTEGLLSRPEELASAAYCLGGQGEQLYNVVTVKLRSPVPADDIRRRDLVTNSSCGLCGAASLDDVERQCVPVGDGPVMSADVVRALPERLRDAQSVFERTGGLHAAGLARADGELFVVREDIGRHNAVDRVIGHAFMAGQLPLRDAALVVSGRLSFEIVQKAAIAGIPILVAVSAPSSLAVDLGRRLGQTVVGFVRSGRANVYSHPERIALPAPASVPASG
ncbi:MAG: formate dehydrogenase accessory protein [Actinomycetia bacterium]|nr:formate dehydrogenase accessory protein [Actinomycetes bacterium]